MDRYSALIGKRVEVEYRAGDLHLTAIGTLESIKVKSLILEDRFAQGGKTKTLRTEIPHVNIIRVTESPASPNPAPVAAPSAKKRR